MTYHKYYKGHEALYKKVREYRSYDGKKWDSALRKNENKQSISGLFWKLYRI